MAQEQYDHFTLLKALGVLRIHAAIVRHKLYYIINILPPATLDLEGGY